MSSGTGTWTANSSAIKVPELPSSTRALIHSANAAPRDQVDDGQQDDRAQEGHEQTADADFAGVDRRRADDGPDQPGAQNRADDTHDDIEDDALTGITAHDEAGQPADDTTDDQPQNDTHLVLLE